MDDLTRCATLRDRSLSSSSRRQGCEHREIMKIRPSVIGEHPTVLSLECHSVQSDDTPSRTQQQTSVTSTSSSTAPGPIRCLQFHNTRSRYSPRNRFYGAEVIQVREIEYDNVPSIISVGCLDHILNHSHDINNTFGGTPRAFQTHKAGDMNQPDISLILHNQHGHSVKAQILISVEEGESLNPKTQGMELWWSLLSVDLSFHNLAGPIELERIVTPSDGESGFESSKYLSVDTFAPLDLIASKVPVYEAKIRMNGRLLSAQLMAEPQYGFRSTELRKRLGQMLTRTCTLRLILVGQDVETHVDEWNKAVWVERLTGYPTYLTHLSRPKANDMLHLDDERFMLRCQERPSQSIGSLLNFADEHEADVVTCISQYIEDKLAAEYSNIPIKMPATFFKFADLSLDRYLVLCDTAACFHRPPIKVGDRVRVYVPDLQHESSNNWKGWWHGHIHSLSDGIADTSFAMIIHAPANENKDRQLSRDSPHVPFLTGTSNDLDVGSMQDYCDDAIGASAAALLDDASAQDFDHRGLDSEATDVRHPRRRESITLVPEPSTLFVHANLLDSAIPYTALRDVNHLDQYVNNADGPTFQVEIYPYPLEDNVRRHLQSHKHFREAVRFQTQTTGMPSADMVLLQGNRVDLLPDLDILFGLEESRIKPSLAHLNEEQRDAFKRMRKAKRGIMVVNGPARSGKSLVLAELAALFAHLEPSTRSLKPSTDRRKPPLRVTDMRPHDGHAHLPFDQNHRDGCLLVYFSSTNAGLNALCLQVHSAMSRVKPHAICARICPRGVDREIFYRLVIGEPANKATFTQRNTTDGSKHRYEDSSAFAKSWCDELADDEFLGSPGTGKVPDDRISVSVYLHTVGGLAAIASGIKLHESIESNPYVQQLRSKSPLCANQDLYTKSLRSNIESLFSPQLGNTTPSDHDRRARNEITDELFNVIIRNADCVCVTVHRARDPQYYMSLRPWIVGGDDMGMTHLSDNVSMLHYYPTAHRSVFVGDIKQLRPFALSTPTDNNFADQLRTPLISILHARDHTHADLSTIYDSASDLVLFWSVTLYQRALRTSRETESRPEYGAAAQASEIMFNRSQSLMLLDLKGSRTEISPVIQSRRNFMACNAIFDQVVKLVHTGYKPGKIAIITAYNSQLRYHHRLIKQLARDLNDKAITDIHITTFDKAQGRHFDIVFVDMVNGYDLGILEDSHRITTALTRATYAMYIVADQEKLSRSPGFPESKLSAVLDFFQDESFSNHRSTVVFQPGDIGDAVKGILSPSERAEIRDEAVGYGGAADEHKAELLISASEAFNEGVIPVGASETGHGTAPQAAAELDGDRRREHRPIRSHSEVAEGRTVIQVRVDTVPSTHGRAGVGGEGAVHYSRVDGEEVEAEGDWDVDWAADVTEIDVGETDGDGDVAV